MNDVVVGNWRAGLNTATLSDVSSAEERAEQGFRLLPGVAIVVELAQILDGYDAFAQYILTEECCHVEEVPFHGDLAEPQPKASRKK